MKRILIIVVSIILLLSACSASPRALSYNAELKAQPIKALSNDFVNGFNSFGFKAAGLLHSEDENLAISPVSIELALAMTRAGAAGDTADEMKTALCLDGINDEAIIDACKSLMWRANTGGMEAANSIWLYEDYPFSEDFINTCTEDFMADALPLIIPGAMDDINAWASEKTHGKIDKIIPQELDPMTRIVLCNALYFLGDWSVPFEANDTYDEEFETPGGAVEASFMHSEREVPYYENDEFSMISLGFKSEKGEGEYAMAFFLPKDGISVTDMLESLEDDSFSNAVTSFGDTQVSIEMPKFEYSFFILLNDTLKALGMKEAFGGAADFSGMTESPNGLFISEVLHKCYIRVDELGAEAAAVTAVVLKETGAMPEESIEFCADRPFGFAIYSLEDNTVAFMGVVNDPTAGDE